MRNALGRSPLIYYSQAICPHYDEGIGGGRARLGFLADKGEVGRDKVRRDEVKRDEVNQNGNEARRSEKEILQGLMR